MGTDGTSYRINAPGVVSQVIDGEALLIAFESGAYYSARGSGGLIIDAILHDVTVDRIVARLSGARDGDAGAVHRHVTAFLEQLSAEGLIAPRTVDAARARPEEVWNTEPPPVFEPPVLEKYTDLEDLLLLDPIHDVDAAGWPVAKADP
jgi:hypothetical protein